MTAPEEDDGRFAERMQQIRERLGISQSALVGRLRDNGWSKVHQTTVSRIEKGERPVRLGEARAIASALGVPLSRLVEPDPASFVRAELIRQSAAVQNAFFELTKKAHEFLRLQAQLRKALDRFHDGDYQIGGEQGTPMPSSFTQEALGPNDPLTWKLEEAIDDARSGFVQNPDAYGVIRFEAPPDLPSGVSFDDQLHDHETGA
jgi:transcriptional regulator with XRE-family HTH domain